MAQSNALFVASTEGEAMKIVGSSLPCISRLGRHPIKTISRDARRRLGWFDYCERCLHNVSLTCRHFGISRTTFYRWKEMYNPRDISSLEDRPSRPKRRRPKSWTIIEIEAVRGIREPYPRWGKDKLAVLLEQEEVTISVSRIGRILAYLKERGATREPVRAIKARQPRWRWPYGCVTRRITSPSRLGTWSS